MAEPLKPLLQLDMDKENARTAKHFRLLGIFAALVFILMIILHLTR